ncbi:lycopene cyclase family protein [Salinigranum salinum]|uniref:lycopene cyclase family protein n=1 Tax=Salinigranum salinum TaxID=1364937 RepID=UPI001959717B|nr:lycopene cyclase family protein [Salinigranum salinum]
MTPTDYDVVVVGAGADGPALAKRLGEQDISVVILEAGPWYGNEKWPAPNEGGSGEASSSPDDLDHELLEEQLTRREHETNDLITGKLRWGPADRDRSPWFRNLPQKGAIQQVAGVGGTSQHYFGNHPRAYPTAIDDQPHGPSTTRTSSPTTEPSRSSSLSPPRRRRRRRNSSSRAPTPPATRSSRRRT